MLPGHELVFPTDAENETRHTISDHDEHVLIESGGNPRQIKRFLNVLALRRRLADANNLETDSALLVKLTVLEYVWPDFFNAIVETVDPESGQSALLEELAKPASGKAQSDSEMVASFQSQPGLMSYLTLEPSLNGLENLGPYLFLAQTALARTRPPGLVPVDEQSRNLANGVGSEDRLRSRTAAKRVAMMDSAIVGAVVRHLIADLGATTAVVVKTHILAGLVEIGAKHPDQYASVVKALTTLDTTGEEAVSVAAAALLERAQSAGVDVPSSVKERFTSTSKLAQALAPAKSRGPKPKGGR